MSGTFKLTKATNLNELGSGVELPESDFSIMRPDGTFLQFEFHSPSEEVQTKVVVKPGIFSIAVQNMKMVLTSTSFTSQDILEEAVSTKEITDKINTFFNSLDIYKKYNLDPKRGLLLWGPPGTGKSATVAKVCENYAKDNSTLIVTWPSDKFEARDVKSFIKSFSYTENKVDRLILVIEDLGGVENQDGPRRYSEASLLSLLDNVEATFTKPTMIIATTNHPEKFLENLIDRPQRFDDVIEVKPPSGEFRARFLEFFSQNEVSDTAKELIKQNKYEGFSVAHLKEIVVRSAIYGISIETAIEQLYAQSSKAKKGFMKGGGKMGLSNG